MYACDSDWWASDSGQRALSQFKGEKWTQCVQSAERYKLNWIESRNGSGIGQGFLYTGGKNGLGGNSGYQALNLAVQLGFDDIILCGFTMKKIDGNTHWHKDHAGNNPDDRMLSVWAQAFNDLSDKLAISVKIYGDSAITAFPRVEKL